MVKYLYLNSRDELYKVDISKIVYFESCGNYTEFLLCNHQKGIVCKSLTQMKQLINEHMQDNSVVFARVGKRHIINLNYIFHIGVHKQRLTLSDGVHFSYILQISKDALKDLKELYIRTIINHVE